MVEVESGREVLDLGEAGCTPRVQPGEGSFPAAATWLSAERLMWPSDHIYDLETGEMIATLNAGDMGITAQSRPSFDPQGRFLAGGTTRRHGLGARPRRVVAGASAVDALVFNQLAHTGTAPATVDHQRWHLGHRRFRLADPALGHRHRRADRRVQERRRRLASDDPRARRELCPLRRRARCSVSSISTLNDSSSWLRAGSPASSPPMSAAATSTRRPAPPKSRLLDHVLVPDWPPTLPSATPTGAHHLHHGPRSGLRGEAGEPRDLLTRVDSGGSEARSLHPTAPSVPITM